MDLQGLVERLMEQHRCAFARLLGEIEAAYDEVEEDEDHHLYHTKGGCRELWIQSLGMPAVLPPPEEIKQVETAIGASRAEQARADYL